MRSEQTTTTIVDNEKSENDSLNLDLPNENRDADKFRDNRISTSTGIAYTINKINRAFTKVTVATCIIRENFYSYTSIGACLQKSWYMQKSKL